MRSGAPTQVVHARIMNFVKQQIAQRVRDMTHTRQQPEVFLQPAGDPGLLGPHSSAWLLCRHGLTRQRHGHRPRACQPRCL